jgi:hypothetical protein
MSEGKGRSASEIAAIERASSAGHEDGKNNEYDSDEKLSGGAI